MGHYRATTTDRYTKSAGLYTENLLKTKIPQEKVS